jgi:hypothetical protein
MLLVLSYKSKWSSYLGWLIDSYSSITSYTLVTSPFSFYYRPIISYFCFYGLAKVNIYHNSGFPYKCRNEKSKLIPCVISEPFL